MGAVNRFGLGADVEFAADLGAVSSIVIGDVVDGNNHLELGVFWGVVDEKQTWLTHCVITIQVCIVVVCSLCVCVHCWTVWC